MAQVVLHAWTSDHGCLKQYNWPVRAGFTLCPPWDSIRLVL